MTLDYEHILEMVEQHASTLLDCADEMIGDVGEPILNTYYIGRRDALEAVLTFAHMLRVEKHKFESENDNDRP